MNLLDALKGISGGYELNRVVGAFGGAAYVIGAHVFVGYQTLWLQKGFDLTEYCLAFPAGLGVVVGTTAGAIALKDRQVAKAQTETAAAATAQADAEARV